MLDMLNMNAGGVLTPDFMLMLDSKDITGNISNRLMSLTMTDNRGFEADQLDIELDDADGLVELPLRGAVLTLYLGWKGFALIGKGSFTVDEVEHHGAPDTVTIRARSADFRGTLNSRREESWHDKTLGEIVAAIATRNKLASNVIPELAGIKIPHIDQSQESDAKFLTRLAERNGGEVSVKAGKLLLLKAGRGVTASGKAIPQVTITRSDGDRHQFSIADRGAYTGVTAKWLHTKLLFNSRSATMLKTDMIDKLNEQMNLELYSSLLYQQMSAWCSYHSFEGAAAFLRRHAQEEMTHMQRLFDYLTDTGSLPRINAIASPFAEYASLDELFRQTYEHEQLITQKINELAHAAMTSQDYPTFNFLQWYVAEQHEEEKLFKSVIDKLTLAGKSGEGLYFIDKELATLDAQN